MLCVLCLFQEVSALNCGQLLSPGQVLLTECVNGLVELAGNPNSSPTLTSSIVSLLAQLGRLYLCTCGDAGSAFFKPPCFSLYSACDDAIREILHCSYNCTSALASVIHHHSTTPAEPLVLQVSPTFSLSVATVQYFRS